MVDIQIIIGARGSRLSLSQTRIFSDLLKTHYNNLNDDQLDIVAIKTTGDIEQSIRLDQLGGKGLFAKEIELQIIENKIDLGLHSMKDMPALLNSNFEIGCWLPREDPRDALITNSGCELLDLKPGSIVGTSSIRRRSQILRLRKDLRIVALRGNIDTRIQKLKDQQYDAIVLSYAGLIRLNQRDLKFSILPFEDFLPAACQGAIGAEIKLNNEKIKTFLNPVNDPITELCCLSERKILSSIHANCNTPIGVYASMENDKMIIRSKLFNHDGDCLFEDKTIADKKDAIDKADKIGKKILNEVGQTLIDKLDKIDDFDYTPKN